jgi:hypothetical protein
VRRLVSGSKFRDQNFVVRILPRLEADDQPLRQACIGRIQLPSSVSKQQIVFDKGGQGFVAEYVGS